MRPRRRKNTDARGSVIWFSRGCFLWVRKYAIKYNECKQILKKRNINKLKSFKTFLNHDLKSCAYNVGVNLSELESMKLSNRLYVANILEPTFTGSYILKCADYDSKDLSMVIEGKKDFVSQVKYYCIECGNETEKSKRHDYCKSCYSVKRRVYKTEKQRKYRQSQ